MASKQLFVVQNPKMGFLRDARGADGERKGGRFYTHDIMEAKLHKSWAGAEKWENQTHLILEVELGLKVKEKANG